MAALASPLASKKPFLVPAAAPVTPGRPSQYRAWWPWSPLADSRGEGAPVPTGPKSPSLLCGTRVLELCPARPSSQPSRPLAGRGDRQSGERGAALTHPRPPPWGGFSGEEIPAPSSPQAAPHLREHLHPAVCPVGPRTALLREAVCQPAQRRPQRHLPPTQNPEGERPPCSWASGTGCSVHTAGLLTSGPRCTAGHLSALPPDDAHPWTLLPSVPGPSVSRPPPPTYAFEAKAVPLLGHTSSFSSGDRRALAGMTHPAHL